MYKSVKIVSLVIWIAFAAFIIAILSMFIGGKGGDYMNTFRDRFTGGTLTEVYNQSFDITDIDKIDIDCSTADIVFSQAQDDEIMVTISTTKENDEGNQLEVQNSGGSLNITQKQKNIFNFLWWGINRTIIEISVPDNFKKDIAIDNSTGDITFSGTYEFANAAISNSTGDFNAENLKTESFALKVSTGDVKISSLKTSNYDIALSSGDITLKELSGGGRIKTSTGDIQVGLISLDSQSVISTSTGHIQLALAENINAEISAKTSTGDISSDYAAIIEGKSGKNASITLGSEPYQIIEVSTSTGDIDIVKG